MAANNFPFSLTALANLKNASLNVPRFNMKNDGTYFATTAVSPPAGPYIIQGYSSILGDGGKATIDMGGNAVGGIVPGSSTITADLIIQNNGSSGTNPGFQTGGNTTFIRCVANNIRGDGFDMFANGGQNNAIECEAYLCNKSNTAGSGGFNLTSGGRALYCIAHDNAGSNVDGFTTQTGSTVIFDRCIADTNGRHGFSGSFPTTGGLIMYQCDSYNNGADGLRSTQTTAGGIFLIKNCNFIKNVGWGINTSITTAKLIGTIDNCGFGAGTQVNGSGTINNVDSIVASGSVTYANDVTPWVDPANGDFRINLSSALNTGRGVFTETQGSYAGTVGYPDIGSAQHYDTQKSQTFGG